MTKRLLVSSIVIGLCAMFSTDALLAQSTSGSTPDQASPQTKKDSQQQFDTVVVTGSLIPQAQIETASPVITITAQDIERRGFGNVYDALRAQPLATGSVQDNQAQGGFTQGASAISLLGLDPSFTLTLIDGHPLADYPLLYNGQSNFQDLTNLPVGMIDHIDILPGNQSSIYGSSAIAGVINIILKQKVEGVNLSYRVGGYDQGGGANQRLELLAGHSFGDSIDLTYGVQLSKTDPIWGFQRKLAGSTNDNPDPTNRYGTRTYLYDIVAPGPTTYVDPGAAACSQLSDEFGGTTTYDFRPGRGHFCGSRSAAGFGTILNQSHQGAGYLHFTDRLNGNMELYGTLLYNINDQRYSDGPRFWSTNGVNGNFVNADTGRLEAAQRYFSPEEAGGLNVAEIHDLSRAYNGYFGLRGGLGDSSWNYDAFYDRSYYFNDTKELWPLQAKIDSFFEQQFLGPKLGTTSGYPIYSPTPANLYKQLTPAEYMSFQGLIESQSKTYIQHVNLQVTNTDLFALPAGSVGFAGTAQLGDQSWSNPVQSELANGLFYGRTATAGAGKRDNYAIGGELRIPIFSMLTADLSTRYDDYSNDGGGGDSKATYKLGLEFRPAESLLFRGNYATAFRAPDMSYTFSGPSGFFTGVTDYYRCAVVEPGTPLDQCTYNPSQIFSSHQGNLNLKSVTANSFGGGAVWSPTSNFNIKADYYDIKIKNEVSLQDLNQQLKTEAACRLGQLDINSPTCVATLAQVNRNSATAPVPYQLNSVLSFPINVANEHVSGIVASTSYRLDAGRYGNFAFSGNYNVTLKHQVQQFPGDPTLDYLRNPFYSTEFKNIFSGSVSWSIGKWSTTLSGTRYGKTPNYAAYSQPDGYSAPNATTLAPWMVYNGSLGYNFNDDASLTFVVNNIQNSGPPNDPTNNVSPPPFYNLLDYNVYGRQYWLEFGFHFGRGKQ